MKFFKLILIVTVSLFCSKSAFSQDKVYKEQVSTEVLVDKTSTNEVRKENVDLQSFVESIYINSSKFYNQALPVVKEGEYIVLVDRGEGVENKQMKTKELKGISVDQIEEFTYKKSDVHAALYGTYGKMFGIVILKLKK